MSVKLKTPLSFYIFDVIPRKIENFDEMISPERRVVEGNESVVLNIELRDVLMKICGDVLQFSVFTVCSSFQ